MKTYIICDNCRKEFLGEEELENKKEVICPDCKKDIDLDDDIEVEDLEL